MRTIKFPILVALVALVLLIGALGASADSGGTEALNPCLPPQCFITPRPPTPLPPGKPDLKVTSVERVYNSGRWSMKYNVTNVGSAAAGTFQVFVYRDYAASSIVHRPTVYGLARGATVSLSFGEDSCSFTRSIWVDRYNTVAESDEYNNWSTHSFTC